MTDQFTVVYLATIPPPLEVIEPVLAEIGALKDAGDPSKEAAPGLFDGPQRLFMDFLGIFGCEGGRGLRRFQRG